jgi:predicted ester cyclase
MFEDHYNKKNSALVEELFTPGVAIHTPDASMKGRDGAVALLQAYATAFPDFRLSMDDVLAAGDRVVVRYGFTGTHRGVLGNFAATGRHVSVSNAIGMYRVTSGQVAEAYITWDKYALLRQLGVLSASASVSA